MSSTLRFTGWAALVAAGVHLLQFLVLGIGPLLQEPEFPTPSQASATFWFGLAGTATFTIVAIAYFGFFSAGTALTRLSGPHDDIWYAAMQTVAGVGIGGWLLAGATNLARRGFNASAIDAASDSDAAIGRAVLQGAYLTTSSAAIVGALAFAVWFVAFAVRGVRAGAFGGLVATTAILTGVLTVAGWATNIGGVPVIIVGLLVIGAVFVGRAKRTALAPADMAQ